MRLALMLAAIALLAPAQAWGGGLTANFGGVGATRPGERHTYVTTATGRTSVVQAINRDTGAIDRQQELPGLFGAPQTTRDGFKTGLSQDGRTLVLSDVPHVNPVRETHLLVLDARRLEIVQRIDLDGFYSVDALAPDGRTIYLVHYLRNVQAVVAYDRADGTRTVLAQLEGSPRSRATSADGRFEYTLYDNRERPFIRTLDTQDGATGRIELPQLSGRDLSGEKLTLAGGRVRVGDLMTLGQPTSGATPWWPFVLAGLVALSALAFVALSAKREPEDITVIVHHGDGTL